MRLLLLLVFSLSGCLLGPTLCTSELRSSLLIVTQDANGDFVTPDLLTFQIDDGPVQEITACSLVEEGECAGFNAGEEQTGEFTVRAVLGATEVTETVFVDADACHVKTQTVVLTLAP